MNHRSAPDLLPGLLPEAFLPELVALFEDLPGILFWIKDADLRLIELNSTFANWVDQPKASLIGKTDADLYFPELARVFMADDELVIRTGKPILKKEELLANRFGVLEWRSTTKRPVLNPEGDSIATVGISRPMGGPRDRLPTQYAALTEIVAYARDTLAEGVNVPDLATKAGMSMATLNRRFREHLRVSPGEFLNQLRITRACRLLATSGLNITEVAQECGYEDPAAFARAFRRQMGTSPRHYRSEQRPSSG